MQAMTSRNQEHLSGLSIIAFSIFPNEQMPGWRFESAR